MTETTEETKGVKGTKVIDIAIERVLEMIDKDQKLPWDKPWGTGLMNWYTEKEYRGINVMLLGGSGEFITLNQLIRYNKSAKTNYRVAKEDLGKYLINVFYKPNKYYLKTQQEINEAKAKGQRIGTDQNGTYRVAFILRFSRVYPIQLVKNEEGESLPTKLSKDGIGTKFTITYHDAEQTLRSYCEREGIKYTHELGQRAFYRQRGDVINMPVPESFVSAAEYYKTAFHEMVHSTGVEFRLNRKYLTEYNDSMETRGVEELVAEIGGCYILSECGFEEKDMDIQRTEAYLLGWSKWITENKKAFMVACSLATNAMDYVFNGGVEEDAQDDSEE